MSIRAAIHFLLLTILLLLMQACGGGGSDSLTPSNSQPIATGVSITDINGGDTVVGDGLHGNYTYVDSEGDAEGISSFRWLRNDLPITGAVLSSYSVVVDDIDQSLRFEVTPVATSGTIVGMVVTSAVLSVSPAPNSAPIASSVNILDVNGGDPLVDEVLTGRYTYTDVDSDVEGNSTFRWLRSGVAISGATSANYIIVADDLGFPITFEVMPVAQTGASPGITVTAAGLDIPVFANNPPTASNVSISDVNGGVLLAGDILSGAYTYADVDGDPEGISTFRWLRNGVVITNEMSTSYTLEADDSGQPITFEVAPVAITGTATGAVVTSIAIIFNEITDNWAQVSAGSSHTLALKKDGTLWAWGNNVYAQLGDDTEEFKKGPVPIGTETTWTQIAAGGEHSLAIKSDGSLWAWGSNSSGALGDGAISRKATPFRIGTASDWAKVDTGIRYALAIKTDGTLWAWGRNEYGQLGINDAVSQQDIPAQVGSDNRWTHVSAGIFHTLALKSDGTLWAWGRNHKGQLGNGTSGTDNKELRPIQVGFEANWAQISSGSGPGFAHSLALKTDNTLWAWGSGGLYRLGTGDQNDQLTPIQIGIANNWLTVTAGKFASLARKQDGSLWAWGWNIFHTTGIAGVGFSSRQKTPVQIDNATNWSAVSTTGTFTTALKTNGTLWTWGRNYSGELGIGVSGREQNRSAPTTITTLGNVAKMATGNSHSAIIRTDGTLWTWGQGLFGELGNGTTTEQTSPMQVGSTTNWATVVAGQYHNLAIRTDGSLWAWGNGSSGQLGTGSSASSPIPIQVGTDGQWSQVAAGSSHSLALGNDGTLWAWGSNYAGQLGDGSGTRSASPKQIGVDSTWKQVAAGSSHSLALKSDGTLWVWGRNSSGQLGMSDTIGLSSPTQVGTDATWVQVAAGNNHSLALKTTGSDTTLWTWGSNRSGQIGNGERGSANNENSPIRIGTDTTWTQISGGYSHSLAQKTDGTLWAWGLNSTGQLGDGSTTTATIPVQVGSNSNWTLVITGSSSSHSLGLRNDGTVDSWGYNSDGQLGIGVSGNEQDRKTPTLVLP